ncbi:hypothetical protein DFP73DRAFT_208344 [Morchella snyderi]|nr:hypothetical protein DFP73DRAFT_208344 [Morchella snyderi]
MGDDNTEQQTRKRKSKWITSYSNMSMEDANKRLGFRMDTLTGIPVERMLAEAQHRLEEEKAFLKKIKKRVYHRIVEFLETEGYPTEANPNFKEASINDLVFATIVPIIAAFRRTTGRNNIRLEREKQIISTDSVTAGYEEFVLVDRVSVEAERYILIIEAKKASLGEAMKQCLLALKDAKDNNGGGVVFGFITTGESWRMISYDGTFQMTNKIHVLFDDMGGEIELWMKDFSVLVDCMYAALSHGGIVQK